MTRDYRTELYQVRNGKVTYSFINEDYMVQYANMMIQLEPQGFNAFKDFIHEVDIDCFPNLCWNKKCFVLKMPSKINFVFSKNEIIELRYLIDTAYGIKQTISMAYQYLHPNSLG